MSLYMMMSDVNIPCLAEDSRTWIVHSSSGAERETRQGPRMVQSEATVSKYTHSYNACRVFQMKLGVFISDNSICLAVLLSSHVHVNLIFYVCVFASIYVHIAV